MNKMTKTLMSALCVAAVCGGATALGACGDGNGTEELVITGSTSVEPLMKKLAAVYEENHAGVEINIGVGGSSVGVSDAKNGKNDFGMASRELKTEEKADGMVSLKIADDGLAMIVNKNCTVDSVTQAEVKALYENGTAIQDVLRGALSREDGSGTRDAFEEIIGIKSLYKGTGFEDGLSATGTVIANIQGNTEGNQMGYISLGSLNDSVKALKYNGVAATVANVTNKTYTLARPFNIVYKQGGLSELAKSFIDFIVSAEGQAIVTANHYIAVAES